MTLFILIMRTGVITQEIVGVYDNFTRITEVIEELRKRLNPKEEKHITFHTLECGLNEEMF